MPGPEGPASRQSASGSTHRWVSPRSLHALQPRGAVRPVAEGAGELWGGGRGLEEEKRAGGRRKESH